MNQDTVTKPTVKFYQLAAALVRAGVVKPPRPGRPLVWRPAK